MLNLDKQVPNITVCSSFSVCSLPFFAVYALHDQISESHEQHFPRVFLHRCVCVSPVPVLCLDRNIQTTLRMSIPYQSWWSFWLVCYGITNTYKSGWNECKGAKINSISFNMLLKLHLSSLWYLFEIAVL